MHVALSSTGWVLLELVDECTKSNTQNMNDIKIFQLLEVTLAVNLKV